MAKKAESNHFGDLMADKKRHAFLRFGLTGAIFTVLGPGLFWLLYPLGPFKALALAEVSVHTLRFLAFKTIVFPHKKGYNVDIGSYLISALPISAGAFAIVAILKGILDRTLLTITSTLITVLIGFLWSRFVYRRPRKNSV